MYVKPPQTLIGSCKDDAPRDLDFSTWDGVIDALLKYKTAFELCAAKQDKTGQWYEGLPSDKATKADN